jgi:poly(beta-D-mannuronate) lyase
MQIRQAITHLPDVKNELVAAQIHDDSDDVIMIRLEGNRLFVESDGENIGDLDANYALGTIYTVKIVAEQSTIKVYYNDILKVTSNKNGSGYYFKAGCYTQTNTTKGDSADPYLAFDHVSL